MTTIALYARYSTDMQSHASVEDQFRLLRQRAERESWIIAAECSDRAISGTVRDRPGLNDAMLAIEQRTVSILLAESLDRISRDQEDLANIYKRVRFAGGRIVTLSEGEIGAIHIGMGGTMSAVFLEQLADKVRRGHVGRVEAGRIPGGISYGYRAVRTFDDKGEPERGLREIDETQAAIVRRIFTEYAEGIGPLAIARQLNDEGVPSPRGSMWRANTIIGHRRRRNGILNNELYRGRILYNRQKFRKDPVTRKRVSIANAAEDLVSHDVPALRIVDEELWQRVSDRIEAAGRGPVHQTRRAKRLLSGLLKCSECQGNYIIVGGDRWGCSAHKQTGQCGNGTTITNGVIERRLFAAIRRELLHPDVVAAYLDELRIAAAEARREWIASRADRDGRLAELAAEETRIADAIVAGMPASTLASRANAIISEREQIEAELDEFPDLDAVVAHPAAIDAYRRQIADLHQVIAEGSELQRSARALIESLIDHVEITPRADGKRGTELILHGDLAALLQLDAKKPAEAKAQTGDCTSTMVAGVGFEPTTFRL